MIGGIFMKMCGTKFSGAKALLMSLAVCSLCTMVVLMSACNHSAVTVSNIVGSSGGERKIIGDTIDYYWNYEYDFNTKGKYVFKSDCYQRTSVICTDSTVLVEDPCLDFIELNDTVGNVWWVSTLGKSVVVDFDKAESVEQLETLSPVLDFTERHNKMEGLDLPAAFVVVYYATHLDYFLPDVNGAESINEWVEKKASEAYSPFEEELSDTSLEPHKRFIEEVKKSLGTNSDDYPGHITQDVDMRPRLITDRIVTYLLYTTCDFGGVHNSHSEQLLTYDYLDKQDVDWDYLFIPGSEEILTDMLKQEMRSDFKYKALGKPNIDYAEGEENPLLKFTTKTGKRYPVGLTADGVVFSFQPYEISGFPQGTFHFVIPFQKLKPYMTDKAKSIANIR